MWGNLIFFFFFFFFVFVGISVFMLKGSGVSVYTYELSGLLFLDLSFSFFIDCLGCIFVSVVMYISGCVCIFCNWYMKGDLYWGGRFIKVLGLFSFSMVLLVVSPSFLCLMVGWDGLGVSSFLLVIYYMNPESLGCGMITMAVNRLGDMFFILGICLMSCFGCYDWYGWEVSWDSLILVYSFSFYVLFGSMTKSAQIPFSSWLPEAMAAPTPVSTLVHSSTLVTAGVYVLIRYSDLLFGFCAYYLLVFSLLTIIISGCTAMVEVDIKKITALSTLSQVGVMMFSVSLGAINAAFIHLVVHAFVKALLFMSVAGIIYYSGGVQDVRFLGGLWKYLPFVMVVYMVCNFSLMGFPFLAGFYSKHDIVNYYLSGNFSVLGLVSLLLSMVLTLGYSVRSMALCLFGEADCVVFSVDNSISYSYYSPCVFMVVGGVWSSFILQRLFESGGSYGFGMNSFFYGSVLSLLCSFFIICFFFGVLEYSVVSMWCEEFFCYMAYMKSIMGSVIGGNFLKLFCWVVRILDGSWIRGYVWSSGLVKVFSSPTSSIRMVHWNLLGTLSFFGVFLWLVFFSVFR